MSWLLPLCLCQCLRLCACDEWWTSPSCLRFEELTGPVRGGAEQRQLFGSFPPSHGIGRDFTDTLK